MVSSTASSTDTGSTPRFVMLPRERVRYLHIERPNGAHAWHGPFGDYAHDGGRALFACLRTFAPLVPHDATWDVTRSTQPQEAT